MTMLGRSLKLLLFLPLLFYCLSMVIGDTDPGDMAILDEFRKGLENPELLKWPEKGDPCGSPSWYKVWCNKNRVSQLQFHNFGLKGTLPQDFNKLSMLDNLGLQGNEFSGMLPSFSGLSELEYVFLDNNKFDTIPSDFFNGLTKLRTLSLDGNPLNQSGWQLPVDLENSAQLQNLSLVGTNLVGPLPEFLGSMPSLTNLKLSFNSFSGPIPNSYADAPFQILWLNGMSLTGSIDVIASMLSLQQVWLRDNQFTGTIPAAIANCTALTELSLERNQLVGPIPRELTTLPLKSLTLDDNKLTGPIPKFDKSKVTYSGNSFCQTDPGVPCSPEVDALLSFLSHLNYPLSLAGKWSGNDPCNWLGIACNNQKVSVINLPRFQLNGTLSPAVGRLEFLATVNLGENNISGAVPANYTGLKSLKLLNLTQNNLHPPVPSFNKNVKLIFAKNPLLERNGSEPTSGSPPEPSSTPYNSLPGVPSKKSGFTANKMWVIVVPVVVVFTILLLALICYFCAPKMMGKRIHGPPFVVHPRDTPDSDVKIVIANRAHTNSSVNASSSQSKDSSRGSETRIFESGNLVISVQVLRDVTENFAQQNELGRGGFGTVYKGELQDGTIIAVKRMESGVLTNKALDEFQSEIAVLSKVRHRHLVSLLGYSVEENERLLVYEYMPLGALSQHLFQWKTLNLEPLSWKKRLNIALDVGRGMEYLHTFAQQTFIHRDLKSSNILLGDDYRAKVSDFGLVKLAPDGDHSVATRLAGTFGYLAPEYAVLGKVTTKVDVFSYGVVLMELVTGLTALDEGRPEERRYLADWFWRIKSSKELLRAAIDPVLDVNEETFESVCIIADLAGYCTVRDPFQRPEMSHVVGVLASLVEKWKPMYDDQEEYMGIDCSQPLGQMVKVWQASDDSDYYNFSNLEDSRGSIPPAPTGFAESFASSDAR